MYYIYQRISTEKQSLQRQEGAIEDYCKENNITVPEENIYSDIITGKTIKRDSYQAMKAKLQKDDVLIMLDLDRLGRNWDLIKAEWKELTDRGIYIVIVNCPLINVLPDSNGSVSIDKRLIQELMFSLLCYLSQKEVEKISIRTKEGLKARREAGIILGRPNKSKALSDRVLALSSQGKMGKEIAVELGISPSTVSRILKENR